MEEEDDWAIAAGGGQGSRLMVIFEICIVKVSFFPVPLARTVPCGPACDVVILLTIQVPWLPLHGIQFRRVGGDGWQYQQLAKTILREMRL